ncbi:MAG: hypothetical protein PHQ19_07260 [Candidatus Krumholzibacteria bacterium]|nr:hypothetical protein [Candidatus Krumholzibacteria bacterium]
MRGKTHGNRFSCAVTLIVLAAALIHAPAAAEAGAAPPPPPAQADSTRAVGADSTAPAPFDTSSAAAAGAGVLAARRRGAGSDTAAVDLLVPKWTTTYQADESAYQLGTGMNLSFNIGEGWRGTSDIKLAKRASRGRDMSDINESLNNSAIKIVPGRYTLNLGVGETYMRQKAIGLARSGGDLVIENEFATAGLMLEQPLPVSSRTQYSVHGKGGRGRNDFKYDRALEGDASVYTWYSIGKLLAIDGGYGLLRRTETSDVGPRTFGGMPSRGDTLRAAVEYGGGEKKLASVTYKRSTGVLRKVDPPRGNSLEVLENPDLARMEESRQKSETVTFASHLEPLDYLVLDFDFGRDYYDQKNVVDERLSKETERRSIGAKAIYKYAEKGRLDLDIDRTENDIDYGPVSLSSYIEKERVLAASLSQQLTDSLRFTVRGSATLRQRFFKKSNENPRDADYLFYQATSELDAQLPKKIKAGVRFTYKQYETINIDATISGDNRTDFTYHVVPRFSIAPANWLTLGQEYEIKMEFTDFTFNENENFLDRTTIMSTDAKLRFYRPLILSIGHRYMFTDTGSYLRPPSGGERLYGRSSENYEQRLDISVDYEPVKDFKFYLYTNYRFQEANRLGYVDGDLAVMSSRTYDSGEMNLGVERKTAIARYGSVDLGIGWVKRFGPNLTPERKEFWNVDMSVVLNF